MKTASLMKSISIGSLAAAISLHADLNPIARAEDGTLGHASVPPPAQDVAVNPLRPSSDLSLALPIPQDARDFQFVIIRGLPDAITMSAGFGLRQSWFVSARDVPQLRFVAPAAYAGEFVLEIFFFRSAGEGPRANAAVPVRFGAGQINQTSARIENGAMPKAGTKLLPSPEKSALVFSAAQEAAMMSKAAEYMGMGDIGAARLLYEDLAAHGSAKGALAMGQSWDPEHLKGVFFAGGIKPDKEKARLWYRRSMDLGSIEAEKRLSAMR